jgi:hypothetical protein
MIVATIGGNNYQIPNTWEELTAEQAEQVLAVHLQTSNHNHRNALWLLMLTGIDPALLAKIGEEAMFDLLLLVDGFNYPNFTATEWKGFTHQGIEYSFPAPMLTNLTIQEYAEAEATLKKIGSTKAKQHLNKLCAILCKPAQAKFDRAAINARANDFERLSETVKLYVFYLFINNKEKILDRYAEIFSGEPDPDSIGWTGTFFTLAESQVFGNVDGVVQRNVHEIFLYLLQKKRQQPKKQKTDGESI